VNHTLFRVLFLALLFSACGEPSTGGGAVSDSNSLTTAVEAGSARFDFITFSRLQGYHEGVPCAPERPTPLAGAARILEQLDDDSDHA